MPVILATQEAKIRKIMVENQPGQIVCEILSRKYPWQKGMAEWLKVKALSSSSNTTKKKQKVRTKDRNCLAQLVIWTSSTHLEFWEKTPAIIPSLLDHYSLPFLSIACGSKETATEEKSQMLRLCRVLYGNAWLILPTMSNFHENHATLQQI
jgi:hypothetical protein